MPRSTRQIRLSGAILAGGQGSRLGKDKAGLVVEGVPVLQRLVGLLTELCEEVVVAIGTRRPLPFPVEARLVEDRFPGMGPLAGVHAALSATTEDVCLIMACDMPFVSRRLVCRLREWAGEEAAVVFKINGYIEPFPGIYSRALLPRLEEALHEGELGVQRLLRRVPAQCLPEKEARKADPELISFINVNSLRDLARALPLPRRPR